MRSKLRNLLLALALCLSGGSISAQQTIVFGSAEREPKPHESENHSYKNSVTLGIASWLNGVAPVYYERAVLPFMSVQLGAGITMRSFMNDFAQVVLNDGEKSDVYDNASSSEMLDIDDSYEIYKFRKSRPGFYASVAPKVYFRENCMDGFYLAPTFELKHYKYQAQLANENLTTADYLTSSEYSDDRSVPRVKDVMNEYMKCYDFSLTIGGHYQCAHHLTVGWSLGFGMRNLKARRLDIGAVRGIGGDFYYRNNVKEYNATRPLFAFNFIIGGCF